MRKRSVLTVVVLLLGACSQNPQFKINTANQVYSALNTLQVMLAQAELGLFAQPSSFAAQADSYAGVMGGFSAGRFVEIAAPPVVDLLGEAAPGSGSVVERCVADIRTMALRHKASGIPATSEVIGTVRSSCDAAARAVAANESSALLLTTAAGDL
jgi:hypothetical protein